MIVSSVGTIATLIASNTFPVGISLTAFPEDVDPYDSPSVSVGDVMPGLNGDMQSFVKPMVIPFTLSVIPGSQDDKSLSVLLEANTAGKGKRVANDIITLSLEYPDGSSATWSQGTITDGVFGKSTPGTGRFKSKTYAFKFGSYSSTNN